MNVADLAAALLAALEEETVAAFAERLRPHLDTEHRFLTAAQAADRLGLHPKTVVRMAREGRLPAIKVGNGWRFAPDQLHITPRPQPEPSRTAAAVTLHTPPPAHRRSTNEPASVRAIRGEPTRRAA